MIWRSEVRIPVQVQIFLLKSKFLFLLGESVNKNKMRQGRMSG